MIVYFYKDKNLRIFSKCLLIFQTSWDILVAVLPVMHKMLILVGHTDLRLMLIDIFCPVHLFLSEMILDLSNWTFMFLAIERLLLIVLIKNYRLNNLTLCNSFIMMIALTAILGTKNGLCLLSVKENGKCHLPQGYKIDVFMCINMVFKIVVPALTVASSSIGMIVIVKKTQQKLDKDVSQMNYSSIHMTRRKMLTAVYISFVWGLYFAFTSLPYALSQIYVVWTGTKNTQIFTVALIGGLEILFFSNCCVKIIFHLFISSQFREKFFHFLVKLYKPQIKLLSHISRNN